MHFPMFRRHRHPHHHQVTAHLDPNYQNRSPPYYQEYHFPLCYPKGSHSLARPEL